MPYIPQSDREKFVNIRLEVDTLFDETPATAGELNYLISYIVLSYISKQYNYERLNSAIGALEAAKLEFVRRVVNFYEDEKIKSNGDL